MPAPAPLSGLLLLVGVVPNLLAVGMAVLLAVERQWYRAQWMAAVALSGLAVTAGGLVVSWSIHFEETPPSSETPAAVSPRLPPVVADASDDNLPSWVGRPLPAMTLTTLDGRQLDLGHLGGRRAVLNFWGTWCPPCREEMPSLDRLSRQHADVLVVAISEEPRDVVARFRDENGLKLPIATLDALPAPFDEIGAYPTTVFVDEKGRVESVYVGGLEEDQLARRALPRPTR